MGLTPVEICEAAGLDLEAATAHNRRVPHGAIVDAVEWCAQRSGRADFGLRLGRALDWRYIGLATLMVEGARSIREHFDLYEEYVSLHTNAFRYDFVPLAKGASARFRLLSRDPPAGAQWIEMAFCIHLDGLRSMIGPDWRPAGVVFAHRRLGSSLDYKKAFDAPVTFEAGGDALLFSEADLRWRAPRPTDEASLHRTAQLRALAVAQADDLIAEVRRVIIALLPGEAALVDVAEELRLSPRTLQRRLSARQATFAKLRTEVRLEMAREYLARPGASVTDVAARLGFSDVSVLSRLIRRQTGASPRELKAKACA